MVWLVIMEQSNIAVENKLNGLYSIGTAYYVLKQTNAKYNLEV